MRPSLAIALAALALAASFARADVVHLASGEEVPGRVIEENAREVVVEVATGTVRLRRKDVLSIERETDRANEYDAWAHGAGAGAPTGTAATAPPVSATAIVLGDDGDAGRLWAPRAERGYSVALAPLGPRPAPHAPVGQPATLDECWLAIVPTLGASRVSGRVTALAASEEDAARVLETALAARERIGAVTGEASLEPALVIGAVSPSAWPLPAYVNGVCLARCGPGEPRAWVFVRLGHARLHDEIIPHEVAHALVRHAIGGVPPTVSEALAVMFEPRASLERRVASVRAQLPSGDDPGVEAADLAFTEGASQDQSGVLAAFLLARCGERERLLRLGRALLDGARLEDALRDLFGFRDDWAARETMRRWLRSRPGPRLLPVPPQPRSG